MRLKNYGVTVKRRNGKEVSYKKFASACAHCIDNSVFYIYNDGKMLVRLEHLGANDINLIFCDETGAWLESKIEISLIDFTYHQIILLAMDGYIGDVQLSIIAAYLEKAIK